VATLYTMSKTIAELKKEIKAYPKTKNMSGLKKSRTNCTLGRTRKPIQKRRK
jgi:hypothetical protein